MLARRKPVISSSGAERRSGRAQPIVAGVNAERLELVGLAEAAERIGISKAALCDRRRRTYAVGDLLPSFPRPVAELKCGPIWLRSQIDEYRKEAAWLASLSWYERHYGEPIPPLRLWDA